VHSGALAQPTGLASARPVRRSLGDAPDAGHRLSCCHARWHADGGDGRSRRWRSTSSPQRRSRAASFCWAARAARMPSNTTWSEARRRAGRPLTTARTAARRAL